MENRSAALPLNPMDRQMNRQGIQVAFGALAGGEVSNGDAALDTEIVVELTASPMTSNQCEELVPRSLPNDPGHQAGPLV